MQTKIISNDVQDQLRLDCIDLIRNNYLFILKSEIGQHGFSFDVAQILYNFDLYNDDPGDFRPIIPNLNVIIDYDDMDVINIRLLEYDTVISIYTSC